MKFADFSQILKRDSHSQHSIALPQRSTRVRNKFPYTEIVFSQGRIRKWLHLREQFHNLCLSRRSSCVASCEEIFAEGCAAIRSFAAMLAPASSCAEFCAARGAISCEAHLAGGSSGPTLLEKDRRRSSGRTRLACNVSDLC